ncbi:hypothetical protein BX666DRAFT_2021136 [Dichotomocladium elegans]|nr:hypothetical protein BX666DRAFT_2021136 [Dichotomocladium elegans]
MSYSESGSSIATDTPSMSSTCLLIGDLHIPGYHFKSSAASHDDNITLAYGYKIATKQPIVAKVSPQSLRLEREFYLMKRLYQYTDGPTYLVRPFEFLLLPSGLTVAIYNDDHQHSQKLPTSYDIGAFLRFATQCTDCLDFIHRHSIIHGQVRLSAFCCAVDRVKIWNLIGSSGNKDLLLTSEGWRKTSNKDDLLVYMSPEQTGRTTYTPDHRSDIYSLGIVFFVLLTGRPPFEGGPLDILNGILSRKIQPAHELQLSVPEILGKIVEKMTQKAPDDRYASARGIRADLRECLRRLEEESTISSFELAKRDVASVFTLPKAIYGRQPAISEMTYIIERTAGYYRTVSRPTISSNHSRFMEYDTTSDILSLSEHSSYGKSISSPSLYSTLDTTSDLASTSNNTNRRANNRLGATIVGVYGPGGIGKSTLLTAVQPTARQHGYVAITKFDSCNKVPYSAILKSLSQILQQILSESEEDMRGFYQHLQTSLGAQFCNIQLLADYVPELRPLLDNHDDDMVFKNDGKKEMQIDNIETRARFHNLYVEVFRAITRWSMTTLFVDDIHLADEPSMELMESLVQSKVPILIFVSYRDEELGVSVNTLLENRIANVHILKLEPLDLDSMCDFICDTLHRSKEVDRESVVPLVQVVYEKTHGNVFYATQLLRTLERKKLIYFDWENNSWEYSIKEIHDASIFDSNVQQLDVAFLVARLKELPVAGQALLKWASFIGDTFSWSTVRSLMMSAAQENFACLERSLQKHEGRSKTNRSSASASSISTDPLSGLQAAIQEGYILPIGSDEFKWTHDRICQAAGELVDQCSREAIHLTIARHLMKEKDMDSFLVADHLIKCSHMLMKLEDKTLYRKTLIEAGDRGRHSGAQVMAYKYYMLAIQLEVPDKNEWETDYQTTLHLYSNAASLSWAVGEYEETEKLLGEIFRYSKSPGDRVPAYRIQARYYFSMQMHSRGVDALFECLDELGTERFKMDTSDESLDLQYYKLEQCIEKIDLASMLDMEESNCPLLLGTMGIMEELLTLSYWSDQKRELFYWSARMMFITLKYGPTTVSGIACMFAGSCFAYKYKKYHFAEKLGGIGLALTDKFGTNIDKGRAYSIYSVFLAQWRLHFRDSLHWLRAGMKFSQCGGDRIYFYFHRIHICNVMFLQGHHLSDTLRQAESTYEDIHAWSQSIDMNCFAMCIIRAAKALQGHTLSNTPNVFDGEDGFNDDHFLFESCQQSSNPDMVQNWYESYKMIPLVLYEHFDAAIEMGYRCRNTLHVHPCHRHTRAMLFYYSLALIQKARLTDSGTNRQYLLNQARYNQDLIREWAAQSPSNYQMYCTALDAEFTSEKDVVQACRLYEKAIDEARAGLWLIELCVIHEYAGSFYERIGMLNVAAAMIKKSIDLYMSHGSYGKARQVSNKYTHLLTGRADERREIHDVGVQTDPLPFFAGSQAWTTASIDANNNSTTVNEPPVSESIPPATTEQTLMTLDILDMASILKSSQVMSSEVKFEGLLTSMMSIILENSGADCGAIIVKEEQYAIYAYGNQNKPGVTYYDPPKRLSENDDLISSRIIYHTLHTNESIFISNVKQDPRFTVGPWFKRAGNKAVISMPIVHKGTIVGCLFVEGSVGIFTQRHITVLSLLCQQMGISISNALLFKSGQKMTMANMKMIEMQKKALEDAKRSKEAADRATRLREIFLANMSHEIRTPFSGFYGMISLLAETELDSEQKDLVRTAKESCEMLLQIIDDLLNFSKLQAGKVALDISPVVVADVIADVVEMLIAMALQKRINVTYSIDEDVPAIVMADSNRLRQILINLLGNAIKFTHEGEIAIRCSIDRSKRIMSDGASVETDEVPLLFEVKDTGIGISTEQRKVLFVPFSQVDGSTTRKYGGTGLGLSICLQLVELMSGQIDVSSVPGKGSNFHFTITAATVADEETKERLCLKSALGKLKNARVLVADKHLSTITMVQKMLPEVVVDGVRSRRELAKAPVDTYGIVIVGLFLEQSQELLDFISRAKNVIMLHYPSSSNSQNGHLPVAILSPQLLPAPQPTVSTGLSVTELPNHQKAYRMAVPIRRRKLLRIMIEVFNYPCTLLDTDVPGKTIGPSRSLMSDKRISGKAVSSITEEERALFSTMHVLAAEDNPVAQKLLLKQLTRFGFKVHCANNGQEAVDAWFKHPPGHFQMGFFDHHMPQVPP